MDYGFTKAEIEFFEYMIDYLVKHNILTATNLYNETFDTEISSDDFLSRYNDFKKTLHNKL